MSGTGRPAGERRLCDELERIANQHTDPQDARWIRVASSVLYALSRRAEQAEARLAERDTYQASHATERTALVEQLEEAADSYVGAVEIAERLLREAAALLKGEQA